MDYELQAQRHIHNLKKSGGLVGSGAIRYEYILDREQLLNSYLQQANELGYPLRKEVKRNRYVLTSDSLESTLQDAINICVQDIEQDLTNVINNEVTELIVSNTEQVLNSLTFTNGTFKANTKVSGFSVTLGKILGKAFARNVATVFKDLFNPNSNRKRKH